MPAPTQLLYRVTARDAQSALWGPVHFRNLNTVNGALVTLLVPVSTIVPPGYIFFLTNALVRGSSATQNCQALNWNVVDANSNLFTELRRIRQQTNLLDQGQLELPWQGDVVLDPLNHSLEGEAQFALAAATNTVILNFSGYVVPRANISLF